MSRYLCRACSAPLKAKGERCRACGAGDWRSPRDRLVQRLWFAAFLLVFCGLAGGALAAIAAALARNSG